MPDANLHFEHFTSTEQYYGQSLAKNYFYTDGVKALADHCQCYGLIDISSASSYTLRTRTRLPGLESEAD